MSVVYIKHTTDRGAFERLCHSAGLSENATETALSHWQQSDAEGRAESVARYEQMVESAAARKSLQTKVEAAPVSVKEPAALPVAIPTAEAAQAKSTKKKGVKG